MNPPRMRLTVYRLLIVVAACAIATYVVTQGLKDRAGERYQACLATADNHARIGREYRRNAKGDPGMLRIAAWHEHMRRAFEDAAVRPRSPLSASRSFPPNGWAAW